MAEIRITDFSGGMVTDLSDLATPDNTLREVQNVDLWTKKGVVKLLQDLTEKVAFPTDRVYDHHVIFPVQGDKDYALIMMDDGKIYPYEPVGGFGSVIVTVTAGSKMVYAGESVYVFYRSMANPSLGTTVRKRIYWDYDTSAFVVEEALIDEKITIDNISEIDFGASGPSNKDYTYKSVVTCVSGDGAETFGFENLATSQDGQDHLIKITKDSDFEKLRLYCSVIEDIGNNINLLPSPGFICEIGSDGGFIPFVGINFATSSLVNTMRVYKIYSSVNVEGALTFLLDEYVAGRKYIDSGSKIKIAGMEYTIDTITWTPASPGVAEYWVITFVGPPTNVPGVLTLENDTDEFGTVEFEIKWVSNVIYLPIQKRYYAISGVPVDENRTESKFTSGTGNVLAFASNKLFTANPYFPDVFGTGEDNDKKGFIGWNYITGEGKNAYSLIPDTQLISPTFSGGLIIDLFSLQDTLFILQKNGISRLKFANSLPQFLQSDKYGVDDYSQYFTDQHNLFLFSKNKLFSGMIDKANYETGKFNFIELSRLIDTELYGDVDARIFYDNDDNIIYLQDLNGNIDSFICSLRDGKPVWVKYSNGTNKVVSGFRLNGDQLFVVKKGALSYSIYEKEESAGSKVPITSDIILEDKERFIELSNDYIRKIEVLYKNTGTGLSFKFYLDGTLVKTENLPSKASMGFHEIKFSRSSKTRFDKIKWRLEGTAGSDMEFAGVFINRGNYGKESVRGY